MNSSRLLTFSINGRLPRRKFVSALAICFLVFILFGLCHSAACTFSKYGYSRWVSILSNVFSFGFIALYCVFSFSAFARRCHDIGWSCRPVISLFVCYAMPIAMLFCNKLVVGSILVLIALALLGFPSAIMVFVNFMWNVICLAEPNPIFNDFVIIGPFGLLFPLVLLLVPGEHKSNEYGTDPREKQSIQTTIEGIRPLNEEEMKSWQN